MGKPIREYSHDSVQRVRDSVKLQKKGLSETIHLGYVMALLMTASIGTIQFGYSITAWNTVTDAYELLNNWDPDVRVTRQANVQTLSIFGSAVGAVLAGGPLASYGRWQCLLFSNIAVLLGGAFSIIQNYYCLLIGRFFAGLSAGFFSFYCPKYISETAPVEIKGPLGGLSQFFITFGILICFSIGLFYPHPEEYNEA